MIDDDQVTFKRVSATFVGQSFDQEQQTLQASSLLQELLKEYELESAFKEAKNHLKEGSRT